MTQLMAVYGTLKRGFGNNCLIEAAEMPFLSEAVTKDSKFSLEGGGFPIARDGGNQQVAVELFTFEDEPQIKGIDNLEGHPTWYVRRLVPVVLEDGTEAEAWMYIQGPFEDETYYDVMSEDGITVTEEGVASWA